MNNFLNVHDFAMDFGRITSNTKIKKFLMRDLHLDFFSRWIHISLDYKLVLKRFFELTAHFVFLRIIGPDDDFKEIEIALSTVVGSKLSIQIELGIASSCFSNP